MTDSAQVDVAGRVDNPHAYPVPETNADGSFAYWHNGMSLRDYFAGQALAGMLANNDHLKMIAAAMRLVGEEDGHGTIASGAYDYADAMLAARADALAAQVQA